MILANVSTLSFDRLLKWGRLFFLPLLFLLLLLFYLVTSLKKGESKEIALKEISTRPIIDNELVRFDFGPLKLHQKKGSLIDLVASKLSLLAVNSKPRGDNLFADTLLVQLGSEKKALKLLGEPVYFEDSTLTLALTLTQLDKEFATIYFDLKVVDQNSKQLTSHLAERVFSLKELPSQEITRHFPDFDQLKSANYLGIDQLLAKYGGSEYPEYDKKAKILLMPGNRETLAYLAPNDLLALERGRWKVVDRAELFPDQPVARLKEIFQRELLFECWDKSGFYRFPLRIPLVRVDPLSPIEKEFTQGRLRSAKLVSCKIGKRKVVLKEGDWWLKSSSGWRNLRTVQEIDECIKHKLQGDLLIIDKIEKKQKTISVSCHLFDPMHINMKQVEILVRDSTTHDQKNKKERKKDLFPFQRSKQSIENKDENNT